MSDEYLAAGFSNVDSAGEYQPLFGLLVSARLSFLFQGLQA
jgi:hypothetical protein